MCDTDMGYISAHVVLDGSVENILSSHQQPLVLGSGEFSDQLLLFTLLHGVVSITQRRSSSPPVLDSNKSVSYRLVGAVSMCTFHDC